MSFVLCVLISFAFLLAAFTLALAICLIIRLFDLVCVLEIETIVTMMIVVRVRRREERS